MVTTIVVIAVAALVAIAEAIHFFRSRRLARLAFGPRAIAARWALVAPLLRIVACSALAWGLMTLYEIEPRVYQAKQVTNEEMKHVVLVLDVSPSMRLVDSGPEKDHSRLQRASELMESFFKRVPLEQYRISVVAVYSQAKPVVVDTKDLEVVRNILNDLPMHYAFPVGKTKLFDGLQEAATVAKPWRPGSATVLMITDGDTVPATDIPKMPSSVRDVVIVGVGDTRTGKFIDGKQSRQEVSTLRQVAARLRGTYHNGNEKHLSSELLSKLTHSTDEQPWERLTLREYALIAIGLSATLLALLPLALHYFGTRWQPGKRGRSDQVNGKSGAVLSRRVA